MVTDHFDAGAELGARVVGGGAFGALGFEIGDAVGVIGKADDEVSGASDVAAQAVGHDFSADHADAFPELVGE